MNIKKVACVVIVMIIILTSIACSNGGNQISQGNQNVILEPMDIIVLDDYGNEKEPLSITCDTSIDKSSEDCMYYEMLIITFENKSDGDTNEIANTYFNQSSELSMDDSYINQQIKSVLYTITQSTIWSINGDIKVNFHRCFQDDSGTVCRSEKTWNEIKGTVDQLYKESDDFDYTVELQNLQKK